MSDVETSVKPKLSVTLRGVAQLLLAGSFPGTHAQLVVQSIGLMEVLASSQEVDEAKEAVKLEIIKEDKEELEQEIAPEEAVNVEG